ncbi:MAG: CinA family nicotinamide mononucleotide deamidase-related protein [Pirellulales bacterium]|nr:CinA family nicotinamide mononucleotide deamidase-related protein [Pirellulales bacterium]
MHAEIIAVGDELTSGQSLDTNSQWIAQRLDELGIETLYHSTVGDRMAPCVEVFRRAIARADLIVITGGLGPTDDDLTRDALAKAAGVELIRDEVQLEHIRNFFARRDWSMTPRNERQALVPVGGRAVRNPHGTAPGIDLEVARLGRTPSRLFALPGVPAEMRRMWEESVAPAILALLGERRRVILRRRINCFGAGESRIESMLPDLISRDRRPTVGITAGRGTITLRIAAEGANEDECRAAIEPVEELIRRKLGTLVFGVEDQRLQDAVARLLRQGGKTIFTAECATAGLIAQWLAGVENSADFYQGGMVLNVLNEPVEQAAINCRRQLRADYGLAIGLPIPAGTDAKNLPLPASGKGSGGDRILQVPVALASTDGVVAESIAYDDHPALEREFLAKRALNFVRLALLS